MTAWTSTRSSPCDAAAPAVCSTAARSLESAKPPRPCAERRLGNRSGRTGSNCWSTDPRAAAPSNRSARRLGAGLVHLEVDLVCEMRYTRRNDLDYPSKWRQSRLFKAMLDNRPPKSGIHKCCSPNRLFLRAAATSLLLAAVRKTRTIRKRRGAPSRDKPPTPPRSAASTPRSVTTETARGRLHTPGQGRGRQPRRRYRGGQKVVVLAKAASRPPADADQGETQVAARRKARVASRTSARRPRGQARPAATAPVQQLQGSPDPVTPAKTIYPARLRCL